MSLFRSIPLFIECFKLAKWSGVRACFRFLTGALILEDLDLKSSVFPVLVYGVLIVMPVSLPCFFLVYDIWTDVYVSFG